MTVRAVEGKKPYTGGTAITVDENKVISLNLRDENNLIIYDAGDDEIYVDLQLPDEITPTDAFPVGVTTGRVIVDNGWDANGTLICAKTTSGDNIKILYEDNGTLWIDNGTGTFKQIYFKSDVDGIITTLTTYINGELAKKQNGVTSDTAPSNPSEGDLWYDTVNDALKVYDGTNWVATGTGGSGDVVVSTDTGNELSTGVGLWFGTETDFSSISTPDTNTLYIQYKSDGGGGWTPGVNTVLYVPMSTDLIDHGPNQFTLTNNGVTLASSQANIDVGHFNGSSDLAGAYSSLFNLSDFHVGIWLKLSAINSDWFIFAGTSSGNIFFGYQKNAHYLGIGRNGVAWDNAINYTLNTNTWYYISFDRTGTSLDISVNTTHYGPLSNSNTYTASGGYRIGNDGTSLYINGYMSDLIIEDKAWTATEVSDYYNLTKGNYGL